MKIYVSNTAKSYGDGTAKSPYHTINEAAQKASAGDEVLVAPGIYREYVDPLKGGTIDHPIIYRSIIKGMAVITGSESVEQWQKYSNDVWAVHIPNDFFSTYNPYTTEIQGDWYYAQTPLHTGEIYLNGKAMYEVSTLEHVVQPEINKSSWDPSNSVLCWYTEQVNNETVLYANFKGADPNSEHVEINVRRNCFYPSQKGISYITLSGFTVRQAATQWAPPTAYQDGMIGPHWSKGWIIEDCDISDSRCSGITLGKYLQPQNDNRWSTEYIKDGTQTEREGICQAYVEGWNKENIGSHIIRRCNIHDCGQTGIVGNLGGVFSVIENNHIHHINNKQDLVGAEIGGIKMHAAIDVTIRHNHIHHCTRGLWLDWQAQGTRVTQNLFHDNMPPGNTKIDDGLELGEDIFIEVSHGPTLVDSNFLLSDCAARLSTQGFAFVHNLIAGSFTFVGLGGENGGKRFATPRYTPYHMRHSTEIAGFMTILHGDARFYNNIFVQKPIENIMEKYSVNIRKTILEEVNFTCGTKPYDGYPTADEYFDKFTQASYNTDHDIYYDHLPLYTGGNVYYNGAVPFDKEEDYYADTDHNITMDLSCRDGQYVLNTNLYEYLPDMRFQMISTEVLGEAFESEQKFETPNSEPITFNEDYYSQKRTDPPICGPVKNRKDKYIL